MTLEKKKNPILLFVCFFAVLAVTVGVKLYFECNKSVFWKLQRINFVLFSDKSSGTVAVLSFGGKKGRIILLPNEKEVNVTRGFGNYNLGKVYSLGELEKKGGQLLKETVRENFDIPVWGFLDGQGSDLNQLNSPAKVSRLFWKGLRKDVRTDLSKYDLLILFIKSRLISDISVSSPESGQKNNLTDEKIKEEALAMEIFNGTEHNGLGQKISGLWENLGGRVIRVADSSLRSEAECRIIFQTKAKKSYSLWLLQNIYHCEGEELTGNSESRADISFTIGEGYWKKIGEKW